MRSYPDSDYFHPDLPEPKGYIYDDYGHHCSSPSFCAYTFDELTQGRFNFNLW